MSRRAIAWIVAGSVVFILIGIAGLNLASSRVGCPAGLRWEALTYDAAGTPAPSPQVGGSAVELGSTFIGLATRTVYGPPGSAAAASGGPRPDAIALDCGDGTYQAYRLSGVAPTVSPAAGGGG